MKITQGLTADHAIVSCALHPDNTLTKLTGDLLTGMTDTGEPVTLQSWLPPLEPTFIWAAGINYRKHAAEMGRTPPEYPVFFAKSANTPTGHGSTIQLPNLLCTSHKVDWECELAIVIGRTAKNLTRANALDYVLGYTCANDVSARDWQIEHGGSQWLRGKSFDGFCPLGPCLVTADEIPDPHTLGIRTRVNGITMQDGHTSDLIFDVPALLEFLSADTTLLPGTVILTGTPSGVGMGHQPPVFIQSGDVVEVEIDRIGTLRNTFQR